MKLTLKDGSVKEYQGPVTAAEAAKDLSMGLYRAACAARVDGKVVDLRTVLDHDCALEILTFADEDGQRAFNHTASHILAQAVTFPPPSPPRTWSSWKRRWLPSSRRTCPWKSLNWTPPRPWN